MRAQKPFFGPNLAHMMVWVTGNMLYRLPRPRKPIFSYPTCICELNIQFLWNWAYFAKKISHSKMGVAKNWVPATLNSNFPVSRRLNKICSSIKTILRNFVSDEFYFSLTIRSNILFLWTIGHIRPYIFHLHSVSFYARVGYHIILMKWTPYMIACCERHLK